MSSLSSYVLTERAHPSFCLRLSQDGCTAAEEERFCLGPPKPQPTESCYHVLDEYCTADRKTNHSLCIKCATAHENVTAKAHCTCVSMFRFVAGASCSPLSRGPLDEGGTEIRTAPLKSR